MTPGPRFCRWGGVIALVALVALAGCKATPSTRADLTASPGGPLTGDSSSGLTSSSGQPLPRLDELQADDPKSSMSIWGPDAVAAARVTRIWLPADDTLDKLWHLGSTLRLSGTELQAWHDNQLRATLIHGDQFQAFTRQLPAPYGLVQQIMTLTNNFIPLDAASRYEASLPTVITLHRRTAVYQDGRMELMIAANVQDHDQIQLTLIPHLYVPKVTILPRSQAQAALDGPLLTDLMLRVLLAPGDVLLIAPDLPTPIFDDTRPLPDSQEDPDARAVPGTQAVQSEARRKPAGSDGSKDQGKGRREDRPRHAQTQPADTAVATPPAATQPVVAPPPPHGLGSAILTGKRAHTFMYQLWILQVQRIEPPPLKTDGRSPQE